MVERPWTATSGVDHEREYLAMISYLPRKSFWILFSFIRQAVAIQNQLKTARGLVGFSMRTQLLGRKAWTLSVWEDETALAEFVRSAPHSQTMKNLKPHLGVTKFVKWKILGSAIPPKWNDALERMGTEGITYDEKMPSV